MAEQKSDTDCAGACMIYEAQTAYRPEPDWK